MNRVRGFTLLEVLVAISILGLSLTAILSAQTGLFASLTFNEHISIAPGLVRCKMSEIEIKLAKEGYPLLDKDDEGSCCADETPKGYRCKWKIQKVLLPPPPTSGALSSTISSTASGLGPLSAMASMGKSGSTPFGAANLNQIGSFMGGGVPGGIPGLGGPFGGMGGSPGLTPFAEIGGASSTSTPGGAPASSGSVVGSNSPMGPLGTVSGGGPPSAAAMLAPLVMGFVYPKLKPMLEASIRKVAVGVYWKEGSKERDLTIQQYVTNPVQGGLDPNAAAGLSGAADQLGGLLQQVAPAAQGRK